MSTYVKNQIIPAAMRILKVFGVDEQNLLQESRRGLLEQIEWHKSSFPIR